MQLSFILKKTPAIKKGVAALLLVVLILSMTPALFLHDAIAQHKDEVVFCKAELKKGHCFHEQRINCHFNPLVVTVPYIVYELPETAGLSTLYSGTYRVYLPSFYSLARFSEESRGPPCYC